MHQHSLFSSFVSARRVRSVFDVALTVHKNIQQRDLEVGRNLGNWILRWLDRMKPSAQIRGDSTTKPRGGNDSMTKFVACQRPSYNNLPDRGYHCQSLSSRIGARPKCFPTLSRMLRPTQPAGFNSQYRHPLYPPTMSYATYNSGRRVEGGFRPDIVQWLMRG